MKLIIYIFSLLVAYLVIHLAYPLKNNLDLLSTGALLSTFGAALITLADIFERDKLERVKLNVHICYNDILKSKEWVRWPFIKRKNTTNLFGKNKISMNLENPKIPFDVGSHEIEVNLPTVLEDFFDLPVFGEFFIMSRFRRAFKTKHFRKDEKKKVINKGTNEIETKDIEDEREEIDMFMLYECIFDVYKSIVIFRFARYLKHFSIGLISFSIIMVITYYS